MTWVDFAQVVSGFSAAAAAAFAGLANRNAIKLHHIAMASQIDLKRQETFIQVAGNWNGETLLHTRTIAAKWLSKIPAGTDPQEWLASQAEAPKWAQFAVIAHYLRYVEGLIKQGILDEKQVANHLSAAGWWARELMCLYNVWGEEHLMVNTLSDLVLRYNLRPDANRTGVLPYPAYYLAQLELKKPRPLEFSATWAPEKR